MITSAHQIYEPQYNSKYQTCMVRHGYWGLEDGSSHDEYDIHEDAHRWPEHIKALQAYWLKINNTRVLPVMVLETFPDLDEDGLEVEGTGHRQDLFFFVHNDDIPTMYDRYEKFGDKAPRWLFDIYGNDGGYLYPKWVEDWLRPSEAVDF